jgi:hypothetical protein
MAQSAGSLNGMCMGCMANADFVLTSGVLGAAGLRVGARQLLPRSPRWPRKVTDEETAAFVASLRAAPQGPVPTDATDAGDRGPAPRSPVGASH